MLIPYGFYKDSNATVRIDPAKAEIVRLIFNLYLNGYSLKRIAEHLAESNIPSPTGKSTWTVQAIDNMFANEKYVHIVSAVQYVQVQLEKQKRSSINPDKTRKTARYNSENVLSGLLVCGECGHSFRRITRGNGEIVWRCADRVENGKQSMCKNMYTISDKDIKKAICDYLDMDQFDADAVKLNVFRIEKYSDGIRFISNNEHLFNMSM